MKTLFINIYRDISSSYPNTEIFNSGKDNILEGFYISLGMAIAEGVSVREYKSLVADFATAKPTEFDLFQKQWDELKFVLLGDNPQGVYDFKLSSEYLEWLKINASIVYYQKYQGMHQASISLDIEELYEDTVDAIRRKVLRFLQENDNYKNFDEFVINDNQVNRRSKLVRVIKDKYEEVIAFVPYEKWKEDKEEDICPNCGKNPCKCVQQGKGDQDNDYIYACDLCGWEYDPEVGYPEGGIEPGTAFEDLPDDFECPFCGNKKDGFSIVDEEFLNTPECRDVFDFSKLFPIHGVILGKTSIQEIAKSAAIGRVEAGLQFDIIPHLFLVIQRPNDDFISEIVIKHSNTGFQSFPKEWEAMLGFSFDASKKKCLEELNKREFKIIQNASEFDYDAISVDAKYKLNLFFLDKLNYIAVSMLRCPYCSSYENELQECIKDTEVIMRCKKCEMMWGVYAGLHN